MIEHEHIIAVRNSETLNFYGCISQIKFVVDGFELNASALKPFCKTPVPVRRIVERFRIKIRPLDPDVRISLLVNYEREFK
jgi:hypothetical protein